MNATLGPYDTALRLGIAQLEATQEAQGSWKGDYSGPLFLPAMVVGALHLVDELPDGDEAAGRVAYLRHVQRDDGSWGLGIENPGCVFTTVLNYVALRLLDVPADDPDLIRARRWFTARGGPLRAASWGRFFLALLNLYDWSGIDPVPPEAWLLPYSLPVHPGRMWCHARMVYLPMSWLYGTRAQGPCTPRIAELRTELYPDGFDKVDWRAARGRVADEDANTPRTRWMRRVHGVLRAAEPRWPSTWRRRALDEVLRQIRYEDEITAYRCIGPVNKLYNTLVWHFEAPDGPEVARHLDKLSVYQFADDRGVRMNGYDSSELWDTAFATQALAATRMTDALPVLERAHGYVDRTQVRDDPPAAAQHYRCRSRGAWPFSTQEHGWPITDCTAEGLLAAMRAAPSVREPIAHERLSEAVDRMLEWQNADGSWGSYERQRAPGWLEALNPSDAFGRIMVDYGHTECTGAVLRALASWRRAHPADARLRSLDDALRHGAQFLRTQQRPDGSWMGSWGVCFTYGTWFGVTGLLAARVATDASEIVRAAGFLRSIQLPDGGWGERVDACLRGEISLTERSQPVQTAWALLTLLAADRGSLPEVRRGVAWLLNAQAPDGTWTQDHVTGVFNHTCSIHYDAYPRVFPVWALAEARRAGVVPSGGRR